MCPVGHTHWIRNGAPFLTGHGTHTSAIPVREITSRAAQTSCSEGRSSFTQTANAQLKQPWQQTGRAQDLANGAQLLSQCPTYEAVQIELAEFRTCQKPSQAAPRVGIFCCQRITPSSQDLPLSGIDFCKLAALEGIRQEQRPNPIWLLLSTWLQWLQGFSTPHDTGWYNYLLLTTINRGLGMGWLIGLSISDRQKVFQCLNQTSEVSGFPDFHSPMVWSGSRNRVSGDPLPVPKGGPAFQHKPVR